MLLILQTRFKSSLNAIDFAVSGGYQKLQNHPVISALLSCELTPRFLTLKTVV